MNGWMEIDAESIESFQYLSISFLFIQIIFYLFPCLHTFQPAYMPNYQFAFLYPSKREFQNENKVIFSSKIDTSSEFTSFNYLINRPPTVSDRSTDWSLNLFNHGYHILHRRCKLKHRLVRRKKQKSVG